jgi:hypothetical protein
MPTITSSRNSSGVTYFIVRRAGCGNSRRGVAAERAAVLQ